MVHSGYGASPLNTLRTSVNKVQQDDPLHQYGTYSGLSSDWEETILRFITELNYDVAVTDRNNIVALATIIIETSPAYLLLLS